MTPETPSRRRAPSTPLQVVTTLLKVARIFILIGCPIGILGSLVSPNIKSQPVLVADVNYQLKETTESARPVSPKSNVSLSDFRATLKINDGMAASLRNRQRIGELPGFIFDAAIFWGCALLVLAEVFRYGLKLQEESELTV